MGEYKLKMGEEKYNPRNNIRALGMMGKGKVYYEAKDDKAEVRCAVLKNETQAAFDHQERSPSKRWTPSRLFSYLT